MEATRWIARKVIQIGTIFLVYMMRAFTLSTLWCFARLTNVGLPDLDTRLILFSLVALDVGLSVLGFEEDDRTSEECGALLADTVARCGGWLVIALVVGTVAGFVEITR